jgi:DNA ligase (NAD+)
METMISVDEIGDKIAESIIFYFSQQKNINLVVDLKNSGLQFVSKIKDTSKSDLFKGMKIVVSGVFNKYNRSELKKMIEEHGGKIVGSVSKSTTFVLFGENMGPSKKEKSEILGIKMVNEDEFLAKIS